MNEGKIIVFEGLDCSFKETTSEAVYQNLLAKGEKVVKFSFPAYGQQSAYFVEQLLQGNYPDMTDKGKAVLFMTDIFDQWTRVIKPLYYDQGYTIIFDRYWFSNIYYQNVKVTGKAGSYIFDTNMKYYIELSNYFKLPIPNATIYMDMPFEKMQELLAVKKNKDINELNLDFLKGVWDKYHYFLNNVIGRKGVDLFDISKLGNTFFRLYCTDNNGFLSREALSSMATEFVNQIIEGE